MYVHPKNSNYLRSHWRAIMAHDHNRLGMEKKFFANKSGGIFMRSTSLLYKILPRNRGGGGAVGVVNQPFLLFIHYIWGETVLFVIQTSCTELVGQKIARLNHKSFFYLNHYSLVHFPPFPLFLFDSLTKGEWTTHMLIWILYWPDAFRLGPSSGV